MRHNELLEHQLAALAENSAKTEEQFARQERILTTITARAAAQDERLDRAERELAELRASRTAGGRGQGGRGRDRSVVGLLRVEFAGRERVLREEGRALRERVGLLERQGEHLVAGVAILEERVGAGLVGVKE